MCAAGWGGRCRNLTHSGGCGDHPVGLWGWKSHSLLLPFPRPPAPPTPIESGLLRGARRRRFSRAGPGLPGGSPARRAPSWAGPWAASRQPGRSAGGRGARGGGRCAGGSPPRIAGRGARPSGRRRRRRGGLGGGQARGSRAGGVRRGRHRPPRGGRRERRRQRAASGRAQRGRRPGSRAAALRLRRAVCSEVRRRAGAENLGGSAELGERERRAGTAREGAGSASPCAPRWCPRPRRGLGVSEHPHLGSTPFCEPSLSLAPGWRGGGAPSAGGHR